ncbi:GntR family transcriptional regulator [Microbacterium saperdae]
MTAKDEAYSIAKRRIVVGDWEPGTLLSEAVVGEEFGMSRTPVHAAFVQLAAEGLLELRSRHGAVVTPIRRGDALDLLEVREALETVAARRAMGSLEEAGVLAGDLRHALESQRDAIIADDAERFALADEAFHELIVARGGNRIAIDVIAQLGERQERLRRYALSSLAVDRQVLVDDHESLLAAVEGRDLSEFAHVLHTHLARQLGVL